MPALSAHLRDPDSHARLAFHPGCPICRTERLSGALSNAPLVSQQARAVLATGVLAISTISPAAAFAREPDSGRDGTDDPTAAGVGQLPEGDTTDGAPDLGDSGQTAVPSPDAVNPDDDADPDGGLVAPNPRNQPTTPPAQSSPPSASPAGPAAPRGELGPSPPPAAPTVLVPVSQSPTSMTASAAASSRPVLTVHARAPRRTTTKAQAHAIATPQSVTAADAPGPASNLLAADAAAPGDRTHIVQAGESLWSIASDHLGPGAGPAQIAREVHRLWQLNAASIGTGDPDLLMVGTGLRLR